MAEETKTTEVDPAENTDAAAVATPSDLPPPAADAPAGKDGLSADPTLGASSNVTVDPTLSSSTGTDPQEASAPSGSDAAENPTLEGTDLSATPEGDAPSTDASSASTTTASDAAPEATPVATSEAEDLAPTDSTAPTDAPSETEAAPSPVAGSGTASAPADDGKTTTDQGQTVVPPNGAPYPQPAAPVDAGKPQEPAAPINPPLTEVDPQTGLPHPEPTSSSPAAGDGPSAAEAPSVFGETKKDAQKLIQDLGEDFEVVLKKAGDRMHAIVADFEAETAKAEEDAKKVEDSPEIQTLLAGGRKFLDGVSALFHRK